MMKLLKKFIILFLLLNIVYSCAHTKEPLEANKVNNTFWDRWLWGFNIFDLDLNMNLPVFNDIKLSFQDGDSYGIKLDYEYEQMNVDLNVKKLPSIGSTPKSQKSYYLRIFDEQGPTVDFTHKEGDVKQTDKRVEKKKFPFAAGVSAEYIVPELDFGAGSLAFRGIPSLSFRTYFKYNFAKISLISVPLISERIRKTRRKALGIHVAQADKSIFVGYEKMTGFREHESGIVNENLSSKTFRIDYTYAYSDLYSIKRFTSFKADEIGGSALLKLTYRSTSIGDNELIIPEEKRNHFPGEESLIGINSKSYSVLGGYGYAWNDQSGILLAAKIFGGLTHHDNSTLFLGGTTGGSNSINEIFNGELKFGYAYRKWVISTLFAFDYETKSPSDTIELTAVQYKFGFFDIRYRFGVSDIADH